MTNNIKDDALLIRSIAKLIDPAAWELLDGKPGFSAAQLEMGDRRTASLAKADQLIYAIDKYRTPDLAKMVGDLRAAKEALEEIAYGNLTITEADCADVARDALTSLKPYEKLFEKEGER